MKQLSIIIPVYNIPTPMLERCLNSVLSFFLKDLEIIIINDGSSNEENHLTLQAVYAKYPHKVRLVELPSNKGVSCARNAGLDICDGEYVAFVDADDMVVCDAFEEMLMRAKEENCDIVGGGYREQMDVEGKKIIDYSGAEFCMAKYSQKDIVGIAKLMRGAVWGKIFRRKFIGTVRFPEGVTAHEDSAFIWRLIPRYPKIAGIDSICYIQCYRDNSASRMNRDADYYNRVIDSLDVIFDDVSNLSHQFPLLAKYLYSFILSESLVSKNIITRLSTRDKICLNTSYKLYHKFMALDTQFISYFLKLLLWCRMVWMHFYPSTYPSPLYYVAKFFVRRSMLN